MIRTEWCMAWLTCVSVLALPAPAHSAGDGDGSTATGATPTASAPADEGRVGLEEIVVTAQKRSESISKVGMTITAFTGAALAEQNINNVADLAHITPGLTYAQSTLGTPVYTLRGVGFYDSSLAAYPAVSVYVDEVPLPFPALTTQAGFDLERVEVLKGPQGILFGQNSTGGAINYIAAKPTKDLQSGFTASYGRFDTFEGEGFVSGPLAESVTARLAVKVADGGDWQQSYTRNDTLGKSRVFDGRMLLDWSPTDRARFELNLNGWLDKSDPQVGQYYEFFPQLAVISPALANFPFAPGNARAADWTPSRRPKRDNTQYQAALRGDFDLTDAITFTSISSYIDFQRDEVIDADGMSLDAYDQATKGSIQSFTQELRVTNKSASALRWLMGSNYENSRVDDNWLEGFHDSTVGSTLNFNTNGYYANQKLKNYAFFGNVEGDVTQSFTLKGGVRYANNKRDLETCTYDSGDGGVAGFFSFLSSLLTGTSVTIPPGGCVHLGPSQYSAAKQRLMAGWSRLQADRYDAVLHQCSERLQGWEFSRCNDFVRPSVSFGHPRVGARYRGWVQVQAIRPDFIAGWCGVSLRLHRQATSIIDHRSDFRGTQCSRERAEVGRKRRGTCRRVGASCRTQPQPVHDVP